VWEARQLGPSECSNLSQTDCGNATAAVSTFIYQTHRLGVSHPRNLKAETFQFPRRLRSENAGRWTEPKSHDHKSDFLAFSPQANYTD
jgi:hypothetical protein